MLTNSIVWALIYSKLLLLLIMTLLYTLYVIFVVIYTSFFFFWFCFVHFFFSCLMIILTYLLYFDDDFLASWRWHHFHVTVRIINKNNNNTAISNRYQWNVYQTKLNEKTKQNLLYILNGEWWILILYTNTYSISIVYTFAKIQWKGKRNDMKWNQGI